MKLTRLVVLTLMSLTPILPAAEIHVATTGDDASAGTAAAPLRTIQRAAALAQPGDTVTVHAGTYRERIDPPRGGESDQKRITFQAAAGESVEIKGSEVVTNWVKVGGDAWQSVLPNTFFGGFNPFSDLLRGDWFTAKGRKHHTAAVYLNGDWLMEATNVADVLKPAGSNALWFAEVDAMNTTITAQFKDANPNRQLVEVNARQSVFYPSKPGMNFITVRGFTLRHAATPWAPPTAEQIGLIGTHWSRGWVIESNIISHSICSGVTLGKYGDAWDNKAESAEGYVGTIQRALSNGWNAATIGHHVVRDNEISHCEQGGIIGSLGAAFSTLTGNSIHDIHMRQLFTGAEMAGIKLHGALDVQITRNHIYRCCRGIWLDWMAQGTRVSRNLCHDNGALVNFKPAGEQATPGHREDLYVEVNHGPFLVDNNLFLSPYSVQNMSRGGAYVHNLFAGTLRMSRLDNRQTPFLKPHATDLAGLHDNPCGDDRYFNNLFTGPVDLSLYDEATLPVAMDGNVYGTGAKPSKHEAAPLVLTQPVPAPGLVKEGQHWFLLMTVDPQWTQAHPRKLVTTQLLGRAAIPNLPFEQPDGSAVRIDTDYAGTARNAAHPAPGPFGNPGSGEVRLKVW